MLQRAPWKNWPMGRWTRLEGGRDGRRKNAQRQEQATQGREEYKKLVAGGHAQDRRDGRRSRGWER